MRVVFLGTPRTAVPSLEALLADGHDVRLVVTRPDRPAGRSKTPVPPPVKVRAAEAGIEVLQPEKVRDRAFLAAIEGARPDVIAVVAYGRILTRPVLDAAPHGAINVHFSLLPRYRGAAPVAWALARGEERTGVTTFRLDEGLDTGEVLLVRETVIEPREHAPALLERLARLGADLLVETLRGCAAGSIVPRAQEHDLATSAPALTRSDGAWDPGWDARTVEGRVRGFDPWPGVWASVRDKRIRIVAARLATGTTERDPGFVLGLDGEDLTVAAGGGGIVAVSRVQPEGRRAMSAREAVSGRRILPGDRLERPPA